MVSCVNVKQSSQWSLYSTIRLALLMILKGLSTLFSKCMKDVQKLNLQCKFYLKMHQFYFFKAFYPIFFAFILLIKICVWGSDAYGTFVGSMFLINEICQFGGELQNQEIAETDQQCLLNGRTGSTRHCRLWFSIELRICVCLIFFVFVLTKQQKLKYFRLVQIAVLRAHLPY